MRTNFDEIPPPSDSFEGFRRALQQKFTRYAHSKDFSKALNLLDDFTGDGVPNRESRCISVGFCRLPGCIAVNNEALRRTLQLSKSSINALFSKAGFTAFTPGYSLFKDWLRKALPSTCEHSLRDWSFRVSMPRQKVAESTPQLPHAPPIEIPCTGRPAPPRKSQPTAARCQFIGWQTYPVFVLLPNGQNNPQEEINQA
jgi:hypothetical protein